MTGEAQSPPGIVDLKRFFSEIDRFGRNALACLGSMVLMMQLVGLFVPPSSVRMMALKPAPVMSVPRATLPPGGFEDLYRQIAPGGLVREFELVSVPSSDRLLTGFNQLGFTLETTGLASKPVPRLFIAKVPSDLGALRSVGARKSIFIRVVLPLILRQNARILQDRARLIPMTETGTLTGDEKVWLRELGHRFAMPEEGALRPDWLAELVLRVDSVPVALAVAQAAAESGWGTSRFARRGNALFGERTWTPSAGLRPDGIAEDEKFSVRRYGTLAHSIRSYVMNLNTSPHYREFRVSRAGYRRRDEPLSGTGLAAYLTAYSERGEAYVDDLRQIIRVNRLEALEGARLGPIRMEPKVG